MSVPATKQELIKAIEVSYDKLKKELSTIPNEMSNKTDMEGHAKGTFMNINNLLSYLIGWGELVLKWNKNKDVSEIDFPETGYKWNELGKLAQKFYKDYDSKDFDELKIRLDSVVEKLLNLIDTKTNQELYEVLWYNQWTLGRMTQFNTSSPYTNARGRIRKWKKKNNLD